MGKKQNEVAIPDEVVMNKIYVIRSQKVMLDKDLAELYNVETKQLKRAVRRNADRFPDDFMFELSKEEFDNLRNQIGTSSWGGTRYAPMAFTISVSNQINKIMAYRFSIDQIVRIIYDRETNYKIIASTEISPCKYDLQRVDDPKTIVEGVPETGPSMGRL